MSARPPFVLASGSPRRAHLLRSLGLQFDVVVSSVDETLRPGESGPAAAERLARAKAAHVARAEPRPVLAADTLVVCGEQVLGKPGGDREARDMLRQLAGRAHAVVSGVAWAYRGRLLSGVDSTAVRLAAMTQAEIDWYVASGEPLDKAGAYHIDGLAALFVEGVDGSPSNVAGLPLRLTLLLARAAGVALGPG